MDSGKVFPAAWALLPGKGAPVYKRMWKAIEKVKNQTKIYIFMYYIIISIKFIYLLTFLISMLSLYLLQLLHSSQVIPDIKPETIIFDMKKAAKFVKTLVRLQRFILLNSSNKTCSIIDNI